MKNIFLFLLLIPTLVFGQRTPPDLTPPVETPREGLLRIEANETYIEERIDSAVTAIDSIVQQLVTDPLALQQLAIALEPYLSILPVPVVQANDIVLSEVTSTSMRITLDRGNGVGVLIVMKAGSEVDGFPVNNEEYTASSIFGNGSELGTGNYIIHKGSENTVVVTGLSPETTYYIRAFEFGGSGTSSYYILDNAPSGNPVSEETLEVPEVAPTVQASNLSISDITYNSVRLSWVRGNGTHVLIVGREGGAVNANPTDDAAYLANSNLGDGDEIGTGNYVVYNGTGTQVDITGLTAETAIHLRAYEYNLDDEIKYYTATATGNPANETTLAAPTAGVTEIIFNNPSVFENACKVWRDGVAGTGYIEIPTGWTLTGWTIVDHVTRSTVASGATSSVTTTFTYGSGCNTYDLIVTISKDAVSRARVFPAEFTVFPPEFTEAEANVVYNLSSGGMGSKDGQNIDRSAGGQIFKIYVKGSHNGGQAFNPYGWRAENDTKPVHFIYDNVTITSTIKMLSYAGMKNVIHDGCISAAVPYGLKTVKAAGGTQENMVFSAVDPNTTANRSSRVTFAGIDIDNVDVNRGGSGVVVTAANTATNNYDNYTIDQLKFFNIRVRNTRDEGFYLLHFNDNLFSGRAYSGGSNWLIYRIIAENCGNEGIQHSSLFDSEVFLSRFVNNGIRNTSGHNHSFQWGGGNRGTSFYMNYVETAHSIFNGSTGRRGLDMACFSNVIYSTGKSVPGVNFQFMLDQNDTYTDIDIDFFHNTIVLQGSINPNIPIDLYNATGVTTRLTKFHWRDNLIVTNTSTVKNTFNGFSTASARYEELIQQYTSINTPLFFNAASKNFKLASVESPAFATTSTTTSWHPLANYDFDGYEYSQDVFGAYSGFELFLSETPTVLNIVSAASQTSINSVLFGTSFATLVSNYLPATGSVTLDDGSSRVVHIDWEEGTYNGNSANTYALVGTPSDLPADVTNTDDVEFEIDVTVLAEEDPEPITPLGLNFMGSSSPPGFIHAGSLQPFTTSPATGNGTNRNYGNVGPDGITLSANNSTAGHVWNATGTGGATGGSTNFPSPVCQTYWYVSGTDIGQIILSNVPSGTYNIKTISSRAITGTRTTRVRVNGGSWKTTNVAGNNSVELEFTGVTPSEGVITVDIQATDPTDSQFAYINGLLLTNE